MMHAVLPCLTLPPLVFQMVVNRLAVKQYLDEANKFTSALALCTVLTAGLLPRATEVPMLLATNAPSQQRDFYLYLGRIVVRPHYNKSRGKAGKGIYRFPCYTTSALLVLYFTIIRPIVQRLEKLLSDGEEVATEPSQEHCAFLISRRPWATLETDLQKAFKDQVNVSFSLALLRQLFNLFVHVKVQGGLQPFLSDKEEDSDAYDHGQGHSVATARTWYLRSDLEGLGPVLEMARFAEACRSVQIGVLLLDSPDGAVAAPPPTHSAPADHPQSSQRASLPPTTAQCLCLHGPASYCQRCHQPLLLLNQGHSTPSLHGSQLQHQHIREHGSWTHNRDAALQLCIPDSYPQAQLQALLGPNSQFRSEQQELVFRLLLSRSSDFLAILPTSGGKSMLYLLLAAASPGKLVCVFVPLRALILDLLSRAGEHRVTAAEWTGSDPPYAGLVFISPETAERSTDFFSWLSQACADRRLSTIIFDEAHLFLYWQTFRPAFARVLQYRREGVPTALFTATCPPQITPLLLQHFGLGTEALVIRASTRRANISYKVSTHKPPSSMIWPSALSSFQLSNCIYQLCTL